MHIRNTKNKTHANVHVNTHTHTLIRTKTKPKPKQKGPNSEKLSITHCTRIGDNGETVMVSVSTEESHEANVTGTQNVSISTTIFLSLANPKFENEPFWWQIKFIFPSNSRIKKTQNWNKKYNNKLNFQSNWILSGCIDSHFGIR